MQRLISVWIVAFVSGTLLCAAGRSASAADEYDYDLVHSSVSFKARHLDISWIHGRFNQVEGKFSLDREQPSKSTFKLTIQADSIDTANKARDEHLRRVGDIMGIPRAALARLAPQCARDSPTCDVRHF